MNINAKKPAYPTYRFETENNEVLVTNRNGTVTDVFDAWHQSVDEDDEHLADTDTVSVTIESSLGKATFDTTAGFLRTANSNQQASTQRSITALSTIA